MMPTHRTKYVAAKITHISGGMLALVSGPYGYRRAAKCEAFLDVIDIPLVWYIVTYYEQFMAETERVAFPYLRAQDKKTA